jgi:hypothetical protein
MDKHIEEMLNKKLKTCKYKAKRLGLDFDLDIDFLESIIEPICVISDLVLDWEAANYRTSNYPTLIRIDLNKGFTKDNMLFVSYLAKQVRARFLSLVEVR